MPSRYLLTLAVALLLGGAAWWWKSHVPAVTRAPTVPADKAHGAGNAESATAAANPAAAEARTKIVSDPVEVMSRALWRRPGEGDQVRHAERQEWRDETGQVTMWRWFLVLSPGPELNRWMKEENPFAMQPFTPSASESHQTPTPQKSDNTWPKWFPGTANAKAIAWSANSDASFWWGVETATGLVRAYGSGSGFAAPAR